MGKAGAVPSFPEKETESGEWRLIPVPTVGLLLRPGAESLAEVLLPSFPGDWSHTAWEQILGPPLDLKQAT